MSKSYAGLKTMQMLKKNKVEFISEKSSVCLLSSGSVSGNVRWCPSVALGSLFKATSAPQSVAVSFRLGWSSQFCPADFLSAQGPGVVHLTSDNTSCTTPTCSQMGLLVPLGGWDPQFSLGGTVSSQGRWWVCSPAPVPHILISPRLFQ